MKSLRIGFCGASGTGKSTLVERLSKEFELPICPIGSRSVAKEMGFDSPYDVDAAGKRREFQKRLFESKLEWEEQHGSFITDRTYFDNLTYASLHDVYGIDEKGLEDYNFAMRRYTHVFYLPVAVFQHIGDDPARRQEIGYHKIYDVLLHGLLTRWDGPYIPLYTATQDFRFGYVKKMVTA